MLLLLPHAVPNTIMPASSNARGLDIFFILFPPLSIYHFYSLKCRLIKKAESYSLILLLCTSQCHNITHLFECQYFFEIFKYFSYSNIKSLSKPYVFIPVLIRTNFIISFSFFLNFPVDFFRKIRYDNKA